MKIYIGYTEDILKRLDNDISVFNVRLFHEDSKAAFVLLKYIIENKCYIVYEGWPNDILYLKTYGSSISIEDAHGCEARIYVTDSVRDVFLSSSLEKGVFYKLLHPERFPVLYSKLHELRRVTP